jgi:hypothetical protein
MLPALPPLHIKLAELENLFAVCLTHNKGTDELTTIWNKIKQVRLQLNEPIFAN